MARPSASPRRWWPATRTSPGSSPAPEPRNPLDGAPSLSGMGARFDHLVVAVEDLDEAAARWRAAGIPAERGGAHPVGTENVLVRGPAPAYVELIAAGSDESNPWLDRIRSARGPISWAVAVDDLDEARTALEAAGFAPAPSPGRAARPMVT